MSRVGLNFASKPLDRLIHTERLWSLDPGNLYWISQLIPIVDEVEASGVPGDFDSVRRWLHGIFLAHGR